MKDRHGVTTYYYSDTWPYGECGHAHRSDDAAVKCAIRILHGDKQAAEFYGINSRADLRRVADRCTRRTTVGV